MNAWQPLSLAAAVALLLPLIGCGTITGGRHADVAIVTSPANAHVVIRDRKGHEVKTVDTPAVVNLKRGYYLMPAHYTATVEAAGYEPKQVKIEYKMNPWMWGNLLFGIVGAPVALAVDDTTGAMWKPKQDTIAVNLAPDPAHGVAATPPDQSPIQPLLHVADNPTQQIGYQEPITRR